MHYRAAVMSATIGAAMTALMGLMAARRTPPHSCLKSSKSPPFRYSAVYRTFIARLPTSGPQSSSSTLYVIFHRVMGFRISPHLLARDMPTHFGSPSPSIVTVHAYILSPPASSIADRRTATYDPGSARDLSFCGSLVRWIEVADELRLSAVTPFPFTYASRFLATSSAVGYLGSQHLATAS
ncbi:hypothetical protein C8F04DRAFT_1191879 [Mycena alexandri]|uniref:Uncharacterized protein n=1 Tax=Mycena alexandri TaxID=1745969 RepID=A0AAD6SC15_9AGAR|nr:hypothetical protein C8F04DRAFT_1191879 [Mycena alexandri]